MTDWLLIPISMLSASGVIYGWWVHIHSRFTTVTPRVLYQSAAMSPSKMARVAQRRAVDTVIDFRNGQNSAVNAERRALQRVNVRHRHLPTSVNPSPVEIDAFFSAMREEISHGRTVLIHCKDGEGRAVMFAALYRIEFENWDNERAYRGTARLPDGLRFLNRIFPSVACLSRRNVKTSLILEHRRAPMPIPARASADPVA